MDETRRRIEALIAAHGRDWPALWLEERRLGNWAERLRAHRVSQGELHDDTQLDLPIAV
jgi:hypothetical protein